MGIDNSRMGMVGFDVGGDVKEARDRRLVERGIDDELRVDEILAMQAADQ
jgi:hypothetical protein